MNRPDARIDFEQLIKEARIQRSAAIGSAIMGFMSWVVSAVRGGQEATQAGQSPAKARRTGTPSASTTGAVPQ